MIRRAAFLVLGALGPLHANPRDSASLIAPSEWISPEEAHREMTKAMTSASSRAGLPLEAYAKVPRADLSADELRQRRNLAIKAGNTSLALGDFAALEKRGALDGRETLWYVDILRKAGRPVEAYAVADGLLKKDSITTTIVNLYISTAVAADRSLEAEETLLRLAALHPQNSALPLAAARLAHHRGNFSAERHLLESAQAAQPGNAEILKRLAEFEQECQYPAAALAFYQQALALAPSNTELRRQTARAAYYAGDDRRAAEILAPLKTSRMAQAIQIEQAAWAAERNRHPREAAQRYRELQALEPDDSSSSYGLAGSLDAAGDSIEALQTYRKILENDPQSAYASGSVGRLEDRYRHRVRSTYVFVNEDSPGRLANISRNSLLTTFGGWIGKTFEYALGPQFWIEDPAGVSSPYVAVGGTMAIAWTPCPEWKVALDYTSKTYTTRGLQPTNTGGAAITWQPLDALSLTASYRREDVLANRYAFAQRTQADVVRLSFDSPVNGWLEFTGDVAGRRFTDDNLQLEANGAAQFVLLRKPGRLVAEARAFFLTSESKSISIYENGQETDIVHPYWSPQGYFRGAVGLAWEQPFTFGNRPGGETSHWRAGVQSSLDTDGNPSIGVSGGLRHEIVRGLSLDLSGWIERSQQWNGARATASLEWAF